MKIQNVKGGYDFLPNEQKIRNKIKDTLRVVFENYGYNSIETPILCYYDILSNKYNEEDDILKEIYKLSDQGKRKLGLRYDLTVPFAKFIALNKNKINFPFKRYEITRVFRDGPVKVGRDREFTQCDVDVVGVENQMVKAELLSLYKDAFERLEIDIIIKYNNRKLMNGIFLECGIQEKLFSKVTTIVDKLDKISSKELKESLINIDLNEEQIDSLFAHFQYSLEELNEKGKEFKNEILKQGLQEINNLTSYLESLKLQDICVFTPTLARGQNYYTGNVFEVYEKNSKLNCSIGGGGRYDKMITNFINDGEVYPAVGISFGLVPIYEILKDSEVFSYKSNLDILIIPIGTNTESLKLAMNLRKMNLKVEVKMQTKKIKKSLEFASREKIPYVIILGEDEIKENYFKLKDMNKGLETSISLTDLESVSNIIEGITIL